MLRVIVYLELNTSQNKLKKKLKDLQMTNKTYLGTFKQFLLASLDVLGLASPSAEDGCLYENSNVSAKLILISEVLFCFFH